MAREAVALVGAKLLRLGDHPSRADRGLDVADELGSHAESTGIRYPSAMDAVCLGILVADAIARPVGELPDRGSLGLVDDISLHGAVALNTASALVRLGLSAGVAGKVGDDALGAFILALLDGRGVDRRGVLTDPAVATSASVVLVDSCRRADVSASPGANASVRAEELDRSYLFSGRCLHLAGALVMELLDGEPGRTCWRRRGHVGS